MINIEQANIHFKNVVEIMAYYVKENAFFKYNRVFARLGRPDVYNYKDIFTELIEAVGYAGHDYYIPYIVGMYIDYREQVVQKNRVLTWKFDEERLILLIKEIHYVVFLSNK